MTNEKIDTVEDLVREVHILSDGKRAVQHYGLINYDSKINELQEKAEVYRSELSGDEKQDINSRLNVRMGLQWGDQFLKGIMGAGIGAVGGRIASVNEYFSSTMDFENMVYVGITVGALLGVKLARKTGYSALRSVNQYINSNQDNLTL